MRKVKGLFCSCGFHYNDGVLTQHTKSRQALPSRGVFTVCLLLLVCVIIYGGAIVLSGFTSVLPDQRLPLAATKITFVPPSGWGDLRQIRVHGSGYSTAVSSSVWNATIFQWSLLPNTTVGLFGGRPVVESILTKAQKQQVAVADLILNPCSPQFNGCKRLASEQTDSPSDIRYYSYQESRKTIALSCVVVLTSPDITPLWVSAQSRTTEQNFSSALRNMQQICRSLRF